jgi:nucleoside-diphosphate-sugar epimerase
LNEDGWRVRALARREVSDLPADVVRGDLADEAALAALCEGADAVFHVAGVVRARSRAAFAEANAVGARRVAQAAKTGRVVLVSSLTAREPGLSPYAASKRAGEAAMAEVLGERLSIARPPAIYGPADRELLPVFQAAQSLPVLPVFDPRARIAMIHVADAARQIAALATIPGPVVTALSDARPDGYGWRELMAAAAAAVGRPVRFAPTSRFVVHGLGLANDLAAFFGSSPMLTSGKARELMHPNWALAPEERSGVLPVARHTLESGFADTVAWYRTAAWMKQ